MSEPRFVSNRLISFVDGSGDAKIASTADPLPVNIGSATLSVTADGVEIKNDSGNPIPTLTGLEIPAHDYINLSYIRMTAGTMPWSRKRTLSPFATTRRAGCTTP